VTSTIDGNEPATIRFKTIPRGLVMPTCSKVIKVVAAGSFVLLSAGNASARQSGTWLLGIDQLEHKVPACDIGTPEQAPGSDGEAPQTNKHCEPGNVSDE
jgi:hypothetical protein